MRVALQSAADHLRRLHGQAVAGRDGAERLDAALPGLAAGLGLLALAGCAETEQLETTRRLVADLQAQPEASPARSAALLSLLHCRHRLADSEEAQRAAATAFQESDRRAGEAQGDRQRAAARLAGAARLLALSAAWSDHRTVLGPRLAAVEATCARTDDEPGEAALALAVSAVRQALELVAEVAGAAPVAPADEADSAFELALAAALAMAGEE